MIEPSSLDDDKKSDTGISLIYKYLKIYFKFLVCNSVLYYITY